MADAIDVNYVILSFMRLMTWVVGLYVMDEYVNMGVKRTVRPGVIQ